MESVRLIHSLQELHSITILGKNCLRMKPHPLRLLLATAFFIIFDLVLTFTNQDELRFFSKPFIIPCLALVYISYASIIKGMLWKDSIIIGLAFSWMGDVFLKLDGMFIPGLISFLIAHIFYIIFVLCLFLYLFIYY
jgi:uncharacterized membrane protein YhhN